MTLRDRIDDMDPDLLMLPPEFDEAVLGMAERAGGLMVVAYDRSRVVDVLQRGMPRELAEEWYEFNIVQAWMGEGTPLFIDTRLCE
jgi:hypothetical protein